MTIKSLKKNLIKLALIAGIVVFGVADYAEAQRGIIPSLGGSRSGTSGFQFLKINVDARSAAMGGSNVADALDGSSLYLNPALAVQMGGNQLHIGHTAYFADISLNYLSYIHSFGSMALGGSLVYLDSGSMNETTEFMPTGTGRTFRTIHMAAGLSFSQSLTTLFSYGATLKYLDERIEEVQSQTVVVDIGFFYRVGDTGLRFAVGLNNFGIDASPSGTTTRQTLDGPEEVDTFEDVSPPTMFLIGAAYDVYSKNDFDIMMTAQITNPSDNAEKFSIGSEVGFMNQFFLRAGYEFGVDEASWPSFGVGFKLPVFNYHIGADYGFTTRDRLGNLHRIALKINL
jgi:hypothetical protein